MGAPIKNKNAQKPNNIKRVQYHNARLPQWLCDWLDKQNNRGKIIEKALISYYNLEDYEKFNR